MGKGFIYLFIIIIYHINNVWGQVRCTTHNMNLGMRIIIDTIVHYMQYKYSLSTN
jgi:hypothetical protein